MILVYIFIALVLIAFVCLMAIIISQAKEIEDLYTMLEEAGKRRNGRKK